MADEVWRRTSSGMKKKLTSVSQISFQISSGWVCFLLQGKLTVPDLFV